MAKNGRKHRRERKRLLRVTREEEQQYQQECFDEKMLAVLGDKADSEKRVQKLLNGEVKFPIK